jgi:pSer/pThr/pTyr-binding forkhead associated (FHA) protein
LRVARVYLEYTGDCIEIPLGETVIGRDLGCMLRFNDPSVSRRHLRFIRREDELFVEDLGSSNGTLVNGRTISIPSRVDDGDMIVAGTRHLVVRIQVAVTEEPATLRLRDLTSPEDKTGSIHRRVTSQLPVTVPPPYASAQAPSDRRSPPSPRRHERGSVELRVVYVSSELEIETTSRNLSESGLFVVSEVLEPVGTECRLTILIDGGPALQLAGVVRRVVDDHSGAQPGLGIEFVDVGAEERVWLKSTVDRMLEAELAASLSE